MSNRDFQTPTGLRDFYPAELLRRRYIERLWRDASLRHGFEEVDGPTFEYLDLYTAKSGEGIVSEIFQVFSGKDEGQAKAASEGRAPFALRPEFTPTLARMYAAKAQSLPKPTRWFWQQNCFRAERPQRGRLREFGQWNCDIIGDASSECDVAAIACALGMLQAAGLTASDVRVELNHRQVLGTILGELGIDREHLAAAFVLLDRRDKLDDSELEAMAFEFGVTNIEFLNFLKRPRDARDIDSALEWLPADMRDRAASLFAPLRDLVTRLEASGFAGWCEINLNIARGLAYYTGMVFEVHEASGAERAIAGGGRYDNLIETFGGPPTAAVGFGMGDVVLSLVLGDRGLLPSDAELLDILGQVGAGYRPDAFVISNGTPEADGQLRPLLATLRAGTRNDGAAKAWSADRYAVPPMHARTTSKTTRNIGKLLKEASDLRARFAVIIESGSEATLKNVDSGQQDEHRTALHDVPRELARRLTR